ncbi:non-specific lipid-transfer protein C, cotyledon-specific isoform-like [Primulina eburnea]|uniref:non-specific lipid-transfer protein C, cotyledon-specific isoform-like n=1 Tax=Primulina eburnea TaxID=1245227 RepID=UPI003C6C85F8
MLLSHQSSEILGNSKDIQEMKNVFFSVFLALALFYCFAHSSNAAISCGTVDTKAASCITYATGKDATPSKQCCAGLQTLAQSVKTVADKKDICRCLKAAVKNFAGVQDKFLSKIPSACSIKVGFPVSVNTDCEKLH